METPGGTAEGL